MSGVLLMVSCASRYFGFGRNVLDRGLHHAVHQDLHQSVGELQDLDDLGDGPFVVDVVDARALR